MGWIITPTGQGNEIWHDGTNPDYFTYMALLPDQNRGMVLLANANQLVMSFALAEVAGGAASLLAGVQPEPIPWAVVPWSLRAFLIIPAFQILGVILTLRAVHCWRTDASRRPGPIRKWVHIVLPIILNLVLVFGALYLVTGGVFKFWLYYMADLTWLILICGGFALIWIFVRTTPEAERGDATLTLWTFKEAYLKAVGSGIAMPLAGVEVDPDRLALLRVAGVAPAPGDWTLLGARLPGPAMAAVAIRGRGWRLEHREFDWQRWRGGTEAGAHAPRGTT